MNANSATKKLEHALVTYVPIPLVETIDALAEVCGLSRSRFTAFLLEEALTAIKKNLIKTPDPQPVAARPKARGRLHRKRPLQIAPIVQPTIDVYPPMGMAPIAPAAPVVHYPTPVAHPDMVAPSAVGEC